MGCCSNTSSDDSNSGIGDSGGRAVNDRVEVSGGGGGNGVVLLAVKFGSGSYTNERWFFRSIFQDLARWTFTGIKNETCGQNTKFTIGLQ